MSRKAKDSSSVNQFGRSVENGILGTQGGDHSHFVSTLRVATLPSFRTFELRKKLYLKLRGEAKLFNKESSSILSFDR